MPRHEGGSGRSRRLKRLLLLVTLAVALVIFRNRKLAESEAALSG
jgi:hypothetical protein